MVKRLVSVNENTKQFPDSVRVVQAANLADAETPEGAVVAEVATAGGVDISPYVGGARGDYAGASGWGIAPTTDSRAAIQAALNAARDTTYTGYLSRRTRKVTLPPGIYSISAPAGGGPSLVVPAGVTFDFRGSMLFFDYPATNTGAWAAIKVESNAKLWVGRMSPRSGQNPPDSALTYDAVRVVDTDNFGSPVIGYADSEIRGFKGAGVRLIGSWINRIRGIHFNALPYGVIISIHKETGSFYGYTTTGYSGSGVRMCTDVYIDDCYFQDMGYRAILGTVGGGTPNPNAIDTQYRSPGVWVTRTVFENTASEVVELANFDTVHFSDCGFEEVGLPSGAAVLASKMKTLSFTNTRLYLQGRTVTGPTGTPTVISTSKFLTHSEVDSIEIHGMPILSKMASLRLTDTYPNRWSVAGIEPVTAGWPGVVDITAGPMVRDEQVVINATEFGGVSGAPNISNMQSFVPGWALDAATNEAIGATVLVPPTWRTFSITVLGANAGAGAGDVRLRADTATLANGSVVGAGVVAASPVVATAAALDVIQETTLVSSMAAPAPGSRLALRVFRRAADVEDTLGNDYRIAAVVLKRLS